MPGLETADLVRCAECGLGITSPRPGPEEIGSFYPPTYYAHVRGAPRRGARVVAELKARRGGYPTRDGAVTRALWATLARTVGRLFLTHLPYAGEGRRVLDVGCGVGDALAWAAERGWEVHGVELDPDAVRLAHARRLANVRPGTLEEQAYPAEHFDAVTLYQTLEHVYSPRALLQEVQRVLRPGGTAFVSLPNFASLPRESLGELWNGLQIPLHLYHFDESTLRRLAVQCGFEVQEVLYNVAPVALLTNLRHVARAAPRAGSKPWRAALSLLGALARRLGRSRGLPLSDIMLFVLRKPDLPPSSDALAALPTRV